MPVYCRGDTHVGVFEIDASDCGRGLGYLGARKPGLGELWGWSVHDLRACARDSDAM